jgi:hypothetical protein
LARLESTIAVPQAVSPARPDFDTPGLTDLPDLRGDEPRAHYAHYEGAELLPRVPTRLWWRLVALLEARAGGLHSCALRMAEHLTHRADAAGRLVDIPGVLAGYADSHQVSRRTGWTDFMRLVEAGLVRQVCAAAPERQARYVLSMDLASLPDDLPVDLARELRKHIDSPVVAAKGRPTRADEDAALAECEVIREGSARGPKIAARLGCGRLHTSPYTREGSPPSPQPHESQRPQRPRPLPFWGQDLDGERGSALDFVRELGPEWARQRGGQVLSDAEAAELAHLVVLLLRHMPRSEAAELLTAQVASAGDLAGVLRWRIGRTLASMRRARRRVETIRVDDEGQGHAAWLAANADRAEAQAATKAAVVAEARRRAREIREQRETQAQGRLSGRTGHGGHIAHTALSEPTATITTRPGQITAVRPSQRATEPEEIFRREVAERHALPTVRAWMTEPEEAFERELQALQSCSGSDSGPDDLA